jgi:hypothetical protein
LIRILIYLLSVLTGLQPAFALAYRDMTDAQEFRLGPIFHGAIPLTGNGDRQYYLLELRGESPNHGFSRIFLRAISLYELLPLPNLTLTTDPNPRTIRLHHQFFSLGFESPIWHEATRHQDFEIGWSGAFTMAKVTLKEPRKITGQENGLAGLFSDYPEIQPGQIAQPKANPAQQDAQFLGGQFGGYLRYYGFFPIVPFVSAALQLGSFLDKTALVQGVKVNTPVANTGNSSAVINTPQRIYQSAFRTGPLFSTGLEWYLFSRGLLGLEYTLWNWDFGQSQDYTQFISLKAGFLF